MKTLRNLWAAIAFHLIPQLIAGISYYAIFDILAVYLEDAEKAIWSKFGIAWLVLIFISVGLLIYHKLNKKKLGLLYAIPVFLLYVIFLQFFANYNDDLFPWSIPRWVLDETTTPLWLYVLTLIGILHALLILVEIFTKENLSKTSIWLNLVYSALFPLVWYIIIVIVVRDISHSYTLNNFIAFIFILSVAAFLFFTFRFIYGITQKKNYWENNRKWLVIVFAFIFPIAGLILNNEDFFDIPEYIFGDFSHPVFYIICILNAIVLLFPISKVQHTFLQILLFGLKAFGFAYVLYFFLIFIPFLPLSILAVIVFGLGFLMLAPIFLLVSKIVKTMHFSAFRFSF